MEPGNDACFLTVAQTTGGTTAAAAGCLPRGRENATGEEDLLLHLLVVVECPAAWVPELFLGPAPGCRPC